MSGITIDFYSINYRMYQNNIKFLLLPNLHCWLLSDPDFQPFLSYRFSDHRSDAICAANEIET